MIQMRLLLFCGLALALAGCPSNEAPRIIQLAATPDSVTRSGVAQLACVAEDPEGGAVSISWQAAHGEVRPDTGSSPLYIAPNMNAEDTVSVTLTDEAGKTAESTLVITVAEGLCGGRPEFLVSTYASWLAADSDRVYFAHPTGYGYELRWVTGATRDTGVLFASPGWPFEVAYHGGRVWAAEGNLVAPLYVTRVLSVDRAGGPVDTVVVFDRSGTVLTSMAVGSEGVCFTWYVDSAGTFASYLGLVPLEGGPVDTLRTVTGTIGNGPVLGRVALHEGSVAYLVGADTADGSQVRRVDIATRTDVLLAVKGAPDVPRDRDPLSVVDDVVYWGEREQGRLGAVGLDGTGLRYLVDAGGPAAGIELLTAVRGLGGSGPRAFWSVPGDLRALVVPSGDVLLDLDRGNGTVIAMCANDRFVFFTYDDGFTGRMYRVMIP